MQKLTAAILLCLLFHRAAFCAAAPTYSQVRAILIQRCISCHDAKEAEGELVMETFEQLMKGGEKGADVIAGNADQSRLMGQIEHKQKPFMPPPKKAEPVPAEQIAVIRDWINGGAPGPRPGEVLTPIPPSTQPARIRPIVAIRRPVLSLAVEAKSQIIAAARPGNIEIWSVAGQEIIHRLSNLAGDVNAVAFSADGTRLFAAGGDPGVKGRVWIWNVPDWKLLKTFEGHGDAIYSLAVSPDGKTLASGSYDQKIVLWDIDGPNPPRELLGHNGAVFGVAFRPDGKVLASVSADRTLKLWDVQGAKRLDTRPESLKDLNAVAWSPDGLRVAAGGVDNRIRIWKISPSALEGTNALEIAKFAHDGAILRLAWSADGGSILSSADDNTVRLFDAADMKQKLTFPPQPDWPSALSFADGGKIALIGRLDGTIGFYDTGAGNVIAPPKPALTQATPRGIQRGVGVRVQLVGKNLTHATAAVVSGVPAGKISAHLVPGDNADSAWVEINAAADAPLTTLELSLASPGGPSNAVKLYLDDLPQVDEPPAAGASAEIATVKTPADVWGAFPAMGTVNRFAVEGKKGEAIIFDVAAKRLGSKSQVQLTLADPAGRILATAVATGNDADPLLVYSAPADGRLICTVSDLSGGGSAENFYRISAGAFPFVTGVFPLVVSANSETKVSLLGQNLPPDAMVSVKSAGEGELEVPVDTARYRARRAMKVMVSALPELIEVEPNDAPGQAMALPVPSGVNGRIAAPGDADLYRFEAKAGETYAVETLAAGRGSPVDTKLQILDAAGHPVQRLNLRAVRDSNVTFRGFDANAGGARFPNYAEMDLNQFVYINGEVVRLFKYPEGPDSEFGFYTIDGKRRCYFGTSATSHALDEKCYVVEPHAVTEKLAPNGLPVIPLWYENDDAGDRLPGGDSRLLFTAPADGAYLVRVTDTRNFGGNDFVYRLTVRPAAPEFSASVEGYDPNPPAGAGRDFVVKLKRIDGFDGPVRIEISAPPAGFLISSPIVVEAGQLEAGGTIYAAPGASSAMPAASAGALHVTASAVINGKEVSRNLPDLKLPWAGAKSQVFATLEPFTVDPHSAPATNGSPALIVIAPGKLTPAWLRVVRNGYDGPVQFDSRNFPFGVIVADMGLNGVQILKGQDQRQIFIQCAPWVADGQRPCHMKVRELGGPTTPPVVIRVQKAGNEK